MSAPGPTGFLKCLGTTATCIYARAQAHLCGSVRKCVCSCVQARLRTHECLRACVCACLRGCVCGCVRICVGLCAFVCVGGEGAVCVFVRDCEWLGVFKAQVSCAQKHCILQCTVYHTYARTCAHAHRHTPIRTHTYTHAHTDTQTLSHTHTHY